MAIEMAIQNSHNYNLKPMERNKGYIMTQVGQQSNIEKIPQPM